MGLGFRRRRRPRHLISRHFPKKLPGSEVFLATRQSQFQFPKSINSYGVGIVADTSFDTILSIPFESTAVTT
jgi:hypothetical protein